MSSFVHWRYETSGLLAAAVRAYLDNRVSDVPISDADVRLVRYYLVQWIFASCWDREPGVCFELEIKALRDMAKTLDSAEAIDRWIHQALEIGIDPL